MRNFVLLSSLLIATSSSTGCGASFEGAEASAPFGTIAKQDEGPRWSTTIGSLTIDGTTFTDVRASCGMFEVMAILGALRPGVHRCVERGPSPTMNVTIENGRATAATGEGRIGACVARAARAARYGAASCRITFSARVPE